MKKFYYLLAAAIMSVSSLKAEEAIFTYAPESGPRGAIGAGRYVDNDLAVFVKNSGYVGYKITGISVNIPVVDGCECNPVASAWVTSSLKVDEETCNFDADIMTASGEIKNVGTEENPSYRLDVTFPDPYTLTEDGIYVGYTVSVTKLKSWTNKYPLQTATSSNAAGGLYYHFDYNTGSSTPPLAKHKSFIDGSADGMVSTMKVILQGDQATESAVLIPGKVFGVCDESTVINATLFNYGVNPVAAIEYEFTTAGEEPRNGSMTLDSPLLTGASIEVELPFDMPGRGDYDYNLTLTKINGVDNQNIDKVSPLYVCSRPWIPQKRVLVEEYTGMWCGNCPEAYVTLKQLHDKYPDNLIILTFHSGDSLTTMSSSDVPTPGVGAPRLKIDRLDDFKSYQYADNDIVEHLDVLAPADLSVDLFWSDDSRKTLRAQANLHFVDPAEADRYRLAYALVEDGLSDPSWNQRNFYINADDYTADWYKTDYWDLFIGKPFEVSGLVYDDVTLAFPDCHGIRESVPAIEAGGTHSHFTLLNPNNTLINPTGARAIKNNNKVRVVAVLIDKDTDKVVNAASSCYAANIPVYDDWLTGIDSVSSSNESDIISEEYFSVDGVRLADCPEKGLYIVIYHYADGTSCAAKRLQ
ncbi:MAG: hypothetical protein K2M31_03795 [Muribaculaceae bacterium]|nr:hypothetical protein [Muribaculaceae bacterium]